MNIAERVARAEQSVRDLAREFADAVDPDVKERAGRAWSRAVDDLQQLRQSVVV